MKKRVRDRAGRSLWNERGRLSSQGLRALCAIAWLCTACACTLEPRYRTPALPVPEYWPIPASTAAQSNARVAVRDIGWREFFTDPRLQRLIELALAENRDLRLAVLNIAQARAQYRIQRAALLPWIDATGSLTREKLPASLTYGIPTPISSDYDVGLGIASYEVDLFGRMRSLTHAALDQYLAQEQARRGVQLSLIAELANAYLTIAADRDLQRLARETLESQERSFALQQRRYQAGTVSDLDLAQALTTVEQARADAARYEGNVAQDIDTMTLLVGTSVNPGQLPDQLDAKAMELEPLPAGVPSTVLLRRPDVLAAERTLRAANANIGAARAAFFPEISLSASIGSASEALSKLFQSGTGAWIFAPVTSLPIFHGGALMGNLAATKIERKIALTQYEKAIQSAFREVADALALTATLDRQRAAEESIAEATGRAYRLSQRRYRAGSVSYLEVLDTERSDYAAQQGLITSMLAEQSNRVALYASLGGGWRENSP